MMFRSPLSSDTRGITVTVTELVGASWSWGLSLSCSCHFSKTASSKAIASHQGKEYSQILSIFLALVWI